MFAKYPIAPFRLVATFVVAAATIAAQAQDFAQIQREAESGDAIAQFDLAKAYISGQGVAKDPVQGVAWLRKSASHGYFGAEYALGIMYQNGAGTLSKDPHEAANWFRKAAKQKNKAAQDQLSDMSAQGLISANEADWTAGPTAAQTRPHVQSGLPKAANSKATPFSFSEVETGLAGGITSKRMTTLVQKFGVDFKLNAETRKRLANNGADDSLLATISASKRSL